MKTNRLGKGIGALIQDKLNDESSDNIIKNIYNNLPYDGD